MFVCVAHEWFSMLMRKRERLPGEWELGGGGGSRRMCESETAAWVGVSSASDFLVLVVFPFQCWSHCSPPPPRRRRAAASSRTGTGGPPGSSGAAARRAPAASRRQRQWQLVPGVIEQRELLISFVSAEVASRRTSRRRAGRVELCVVEPKCGLNKYRSFAFTDDLMSLTW